MKKQITLICFALFAGISISQAQTKTSNKLGKSLKLSKNDSIMCSKDWKTVVVEKEGKKTKPGDNYKNDMLSMKLNGKYNLVLEGNPKAGSWNRAGQFIYFTDSLSSEKIIYQVIEVEQKKLKLEYHDANQVQSVFEMKPR
jgi:hypothetical protein